MRILVLDTNVPYANPTPRVLLAALARRADVVFGGLGYDVDTSSLKALEQRTGRFDVILGQTWMFGQPGAGQYGPWIPRDLRDHPAPKVLNLLQVDPHGLPQYIHESCVQPAAAVLATVASPQFPIPDPGLAAQRETWFDANQFMVRNPDLIDERWLLVPHCLDEAEFVPIGTARKRWDAIVPGIRYWFRAAAQAHLAARPDIRVTSLDGVVQRALYWATSYYKAQKYVDATGWFHKRFRNRIAQCRVAVTCDGSIGYPVRKFFEIPAFGTLLAARFFGNMDALGFVDGQNCIALPDESFARLDEVIALTRSDSAEIRGVIEAGRAMVRECHTATRRAEQVVDLLAALVDGRLGTSRWSDGRQIIRAPGEVVS